MQHFCVRSTSGAEMSKGYVGTSAEMSRVQSVLGPKFLDTHALA